MCAVNVMCSVNLTGCQLSEFIYPAYLFPRHNTMEPCSRIIALIFARLVLTSDEETFEKLSLYGD